MVRNMASDRDAMEIPVIDIGGFLIGSDDQKQQTADLVDRTNREVGFLLITGHGIDRASIDGMFEVSRGFFEGPGDAKLAVKAPPGEQQGYHGLGQSGLAAKEGKEAPPDIREYFMAGRLDLDDPYFREGDAKNFYRPNRWPEGQDVFRQQTEAYYSKMERLGGRLMQLFGLALGAGEGFFADKIDRHFAILSSIYYPAQNVPPQPGQLRAGAHTDYGALTILAPSDSPGGLEVLDRQGNWRAVPYMPDAFVINIGDMMQRWTNERWTSNMHRVVSPPDSARQTGARQSLAFFLHPNFDAIVDAIPGTVPQGAAAIHPPILAGQYMREKEEEIASGKPKARTA
jgi:isopenicillin N synthase-like dioxygenase